MNGTLTVTKSTKVLKVVANSNSWQYDGKQHADGGYTVTYGSETYTVAAGESATLSTGDKVTAVITKQVTNVADTVTGNNEIVTLTVENEGQYANIVKEAGTLTITKKPLKVSDSLKVEYNGADQTLTIGKDAKNYKVESLVSGETLTLTGATITGRAAGTYTTLDGITDTNPTPYTWSVTKADGTTDSTGNYTIEVTGKLEITPREATVSFVGSDVTRVYNGAEQKFTTTEVVKDKKDATSDSYILVTGLVGNDTVLEGTIQHSMAGTDVGTYNGEFVYSGAHAPEGETNPTPTIMNGNLDVTNSYTFSTNTEGKLTITKRPVEITANNNTVEYDGQPHGVNTANPYTVTAATADTGLVTGHVLTDVEIAFKATKAGTYTNELSIAKTTENGKVTKPCIKDGSGEGAKNVTDNYEITLVPGTLTITQSTKPLVITSGSKTWVYDGEEHTNPVYTVTYDGTAITAGADGKFNLPTGDVLTITPDDNAKVQFVGDYKENNTFTYTILSGSKVQDYETGNWFHEDRTDSYGNVTKTFGTLSIGKRRIAIQAASHEWQYKDTQGVEQTYPYFNVAEWTGTDQSAPADSDWHKNEDDMRTEYAVGTDVPLTTLDYIDHKMSGVAVTGAITYVGTEANVPTADNVVIRRGTGDNAKIVTDCYEVIKLYNGTLTITGDPVEPTKTIVKENADDKYDFGDKIQFTINVKNTTTQTLTDVTVYDATAEIDLPAGDNFTYGDDNHTVKIKSIASGETIALTAWHTVTEADITQKFYKNEVVTKVKYSDKDYELKADETTTDLEEPRKGLKLNKRLVLALGSELDVDESKTFRAGETAYFLIEVTNTGNQTLTNITVNELSTWLKGEALFVNATDTWTIDTLAPGQTKKGYAYYDVTQEDLQDNVNTPKNVVTASSDDPDLPTPTPAEKEIPLPTPVKLTIHYLFADGTTAFPDYEAILRPGMPYSVLSPVLEGYLFRTPVEGIMPDEDHVEIVRYIPEGGGGGGEGGEDEDPEEPPRNVTTLVDYPTPLGLNNVFMNVCDCFE